jgi:hypothetical protein
MAREYAERVEYEDFVLARWQETGDDGVVRDRWDILKDGWVLATVTDREHAESYVDHHRHDERAGDE